jgi:hypothetical protein
VSEGRVEIVTRYFASGWATRNSAGAEHVVARRQGRFLGMAVADMPRGDLVGQAKPRRGFVILFNTPLRADEVADVRVSPWNDSYPLAMAKDIHRGLSSLRQVIVVGSPRSGTSELAATISGVLDLPWMGELHAAGSFARAAEALSTGPSTDESVARRFAESGARTLAFEAARKFYYLVHRSASFLDKTPGTDMIRALPFMRECFPEAKIVSVRRNGISNVLSRLAKFGGDFEEHCNDWAAAVNAWDEVKNDLGPILEVEQEAMLERPEVVARDLARFLESPAIAGPITASLRSGSHERTGAGIGKATFSSTGWSADQIDCFRTVCGPVMVRLGYAMI